MAATGTGRASIAWVDRWVRMTIEVTNAVGRKITLTQVDIGFVRRSTQLLILGRKTCMICGYKTIYQQDEEEEDRRKREEERTRPHSTKINLGKVTGDSHDTEVKGSDKSKSSEPTDDSIPIKLMYDTSNGELRIVTICIYGDAP